VLTFAAALGLAAFMAVQSSAPPPQNADPPATLPVSLGRIREALKKQEGKLAVPLPRADFRVDIAEEQHFQELVDLLDFSAAPVQPGVLFGGSQTQPLFTVNMNGIGRSMTKAIAKARHQRAERLAQEEVQRAFIQFCSTHECAAR
jgi:hypothetical protein